MTGREAFELDPTLIDELADRLSDAIAERVVAAFTEGSIQQARTSVAWLDAQQVAQQLGVSRDWVYEHADDLGASRIGAGPRPRLRFPPDILKSRNSEPAPGGATIKPSKRPKRSGLIPIRGS
jgi:predicted DNA-binding transcriptional regulator AlpA